MIKIGNLTTGAVRFLFGLMIVGLVSVSSHAQDLTLEATVSESKIFTGEQFSLSIQVESSQSHNMELPTLPDMDGIRVLSSNPARSTSISMINGVTTRTTTYTYTFIAMDAGDYTIPPIDIRVDGEVKQTNPIDIEVLEKSSLSGDHTQLPDIFVQVEVDDEQPVVGQQMVASVVLYFKQGVEVTSYQPSFGWRTDGFWKEELENISQPQAESTIMNGVRYRRATLLRYALFPSRSGEFTLDEYELQAGIRSQPRRDDRFGSFFGGPGSNQRRVTLSSDPVTINVQPLPGREESIGINAVGDLSVERSVNSTQIKSGEAIELVTKIEGEGNIPLINRPEYAFPDGFDKFNPRESSNVERRGLSIRGDKSFTELLVSRAPGNYEFPEEQIAVFDPDTRSYRYVTLPAIEFEVLPAATPAVAASETGSSTLQPFTGLAIWYSGEPTPFYKTAWFWIFLVIPGIALLVGWRQKHHLERMMTDETFRRKQLSFETATKRLETAKEHFSNDRPKEVYNYLHKALSGFISDKVGLPEAGYSDEKLISIVQENVSLNGEITKPLKALLEKCNTISYAPAGGKEDIQNDIEKTEKLISDLKKKL